jgi:hypothetical protein
MNPDDDSSERWCEATMKEPTICKQCGMPGPAGEAMRCECPEGHDGPHVFFGKTGVHVVGGDEEACALPRLRRSAARELALQPKVEDAIAAIDSELDLIKTLVRLQALRERARDPQDIAALNVALLALGVAGTCRSCSPEVVAQLERVNRMLRLPRGDAS